MQNTIPRTSRYQTAGEIKYPIQINPDTAFQYCTDEIQTNVNNQDNKFGSNPPYNLNMSNQVGNGIGTESFNSDVSSRPKTLQDKVELIHQQNVPYISPRDGPPAAIPLSEIINNHDGYVFQNQQLAGGPSGRSGIPAVIAPPSHSEEYWKTNDFLVRSGINSETSVDLTRSGYLVQEDTNNNRIIEPYESESPLKTKSVMINHDTSTGESQVRYGSMIESVGANPPMPTANTREHFEEPCEPKGSLRYQYTTNLQQQPQRNVIAPRSQCSSNNYDSPPKKGCVKELVTVGPIDEEMINMPYGYNPNQLEISNIPSNLPTGDVARDPVFNTYNKDIFTTTIQPGVYSRTEIIEPINSNIGISFPQQFEPVECEKTQDGGVVFVHKDSRITPVNQKVDITPDGPNEANVYDPRFTGYGTNYRSYIDKVTGQPRFYYDDVMVHRQNNYVTRNKIDFTDFGPKNNQINQQHTNAEIRKLAQNAFTDNAINFRTELQTRLLRKVNVNAWQQKVAPINQMI